MHSFDFTRHAVVKYLVLVVISLGLINHPSLPQHRRTSLLVSYIWCWVTQLVLVVPFFWRPCFATSSYIPVVAVEWLHYRRHFHTVDTFLDWGLDTRTLYYVVINARFEKARWCYTMTQQIYITDSRPKNLIRPLPLISFVLFLNKYRRVLKWLFIVVSQGWCCLLCGNLICKEIECFRCGCHHDSFLSQIRSTFLFLISLQKH